MRLDLELKKKDCIEAEMQSEKGTRLAGRHDSDRILSERAILRRPTPQKPSIASGLELQP